MKKLFITLIASVLIFHTGYSQVAQQWVQRYNSQQDRNDNASDIAIDITGNIYVTGGSFGPDTSLDIVTIKYNSSGVQQWIQRYNGPAGMGDYASAIEVDASGNVYVTGQSMNLDSTFDYLTIKYNSTGVQQWVQRYNGPANNDDMAYGVAFDTSGNVYVTGASIGNGSDYDYATIKYNPGGVQQWVQRYNGPDNIFDYAYDIAVDRQGNILITGESVGHQTDYATIKYSSLGVQQWVSRYNGPASWIDNAYALTVDSACNIYVTGESWGTVSGSDYATIKYNPSGVQQWVSRYNGPANLADNAYAIAVDASGNVYITGQSVGNLTDFDYATVKYDSSGVQQWASRYNGPPSSIDNAYAIAVDASGNVYVSGESRRNGIQFDYATIKYSSSGIQQWLERYNGPANSDDHAFALALDSSGNVYVTGKSTGTGTDFDYATVKYSQLVGVQQTYSQMPEKFLLEQNYPNPFNPATTIKFDVPKQSFTRLVIYDVTGRTVSTVINEDLKPGAYEYVFDAAGIASGVYFYKIAAGDFNDVKKMILLK